jgi:hypothetical protein
MELFKILQMVGTVIAGAAVLLVCTVGVVVWFAGGRSNRRRD